MSDRAIKIGVASPYNLHDMAERRFARASRTSTRGNYSAQESRGQNFALGRTSPFEDAERTTATAYGGSIDSNSVRPTGVMFLPGHLNRIRYKAQEN